MKRRLNYTGRKRIKRKNISISFVKQNGRVVSFNLNKLDIDNLGLPGDAKVYVEAYYKTELKRFDFGTVSTISCPSSLSLADLAYPENLKFRILIVNPSNNKILAHATAITPEEQAEKKSILPVEFIDLGNEIWQINYEGEEGSPILSINKRIPNIENIAKQDPQFFIYVYPAVIREILTRMIFDYGVDSTDDPTTDWHRDWLQFSISLGCPPPEILDPSNEAFDRDVALKWIDDVVTAFTDTYSQRFQEYLRKLEGET